MFKKYVLPNILLEAILLPIIARAALGGDKKLPSLNLLARQSTYFNCNGASQCTQVTLTDGGSSVVDYLDLGANLNNSGMPDGQQYCNNQNIICISESIAINLNVGIQLPAGIQVGTPVRIANIDGAICAFIKGYNGTKPIYLTEIRALMDQLYFNGCTRCGYIDLNWLNNGKDNIQGQLGIDWRQPGSDACIGACIGSRQNTTIANVQCTPSPTSTATSDASALMVPNLFGNGMAPVWWAVAMTILEAVIII